MHQAELQGHERAADQRVRDDLEGVGAVLEAEDGAHLEVVLQALADARQLRHSALDTYKLLRCQYSNFALGKQVN